MRFVNANVNGKHRPEELKEEQKKMFKSRRKLWMNRASQVDKNGPTNKKDFNP